MTITNKMPSRKDIKKILVANRGEIAIRIIKTAKRLGIATVGICSNTDKNSYFTEIPDEIYPIGGDLPRESYLDIDKIIEAVQKTGADAVHPGYGFLSENPSFIERIEEIGVTFIGPSSHSVRIMGDKVSAKSAAKSAGISVVPGFIEEVKSIKQLHEVVKSIGMPIIIKASAGGGGKGMRVVYKESELESSFESCVNEAEKNFKNKIVFIEKYIESPRHIEIQILGDKNGNIVCLGERECSIQRFNQKIMEEAPSTFVDEKMRKRMYEESVMLAKASKYYSAGTVEYVVDKHKNFYFLEMNTRLQVEHGVSEMITGVDIVEQMIRIAEGKKLPFKQQDIKLNGWAIEARVYAEDPSHGFAPSAGRIARYIAPKERKGVLRLETSYVYGGYVSQYYDPMIAKVIAFGEVRSEAINVMKNALSNYVIEGIKTNLFMLEAILMNKEFELGDLSTDFVKKNYPDGFGGLPLNNNTSVIFTLAAVALHCWSEKKLNTKSNPIQFVPGNISNLDLKSVAVVIGEEKRLIRIVEEQEDGKKFRVKIDNSGTVVFIAEKIDDYFVKVSFEVDKDGEIKTKYTKNTMLCKCEEVVKIKHIVASKYTMSTRAVSHIVATYPFHIAELLRYMLPPKESVKIRNKLISPMTGLITSIKIKEGEKFSTGNILAVIEAMKMESTIQADFDGIVSKVIKKDGNIVSEGDVIMEFEQ